jgi:hypothetical protein
LGGFIGSTGNENHYAKTARDNGRKPTRKKTQTGEEGRRVFSESFEENPREEDPIPDRQFCIRSISTVAGREVCSEWAHSASSSRHPRDNPVPTEVPGCQWDALKPQ